MTAIQPGLFPCTHCGQTNHYHEMVFFAHHLHKLPISDQLPEGQLPTQTLEPQYARTLITSSALEHSTGTCTSVTTAEVATPMGHAPTKGAGTKPLRYDHSYSNGN